MFKLTREQHQQWDQKIRELLNALSREELDRIASSLWRENCQTAERN